MVAWFCAVVCFGAFAALGVAVRGRPPGPLDMRGLALRGHGYALAVFFTRLGRWYGVGIVALCAVTAAAALHLRPLPIVGLFLAQLCVQAAVNALKLVFRRDRPDDPLHRHERGFSYPSGHAATAALFFGGLLLFVVNSNDVPAALVSLSAGILCVCVLGIPWSRLALGAHYFSDVVGGLLFGGGSLAVLVALAETSGKLGFSL